jgi:hypothetical protein
MILGRSTCKVCGELLTETDDIVALPALSPGQHDVLWPFSNAAFHESCYEELPERAAVEHRIARLDADDQVLFAVLGTFTSSNPVDQLSDFLRGELASGRSREDLYTQLESLRAAARESGNTATGNRLTAAIEVLADL